MLFTVFRSGSIHSTPNNDQDDWRPACSESPISSQAIGFRGNESWKLRCVDDTHAADIVAPLPHERNGLRHVIHMTLGTDPTGIPRSQQVGAGRFLIATVRIGAELHCADFDTPDSCLDEACYPRRLSWILQRLDVWQKSSGIQAAVRPLQPSVNGAPVAYLSLLLASKININSYLSVT